MEERVAMNTIEVGSIFKMTLRPEEGVKPKHSQDTDRTKYFVVIGISSDRIVVGSVLINSHINPKLFNIIGPYQHLISWEDYTFLTKPESFIGGGRIYRLCQRGGYASCHIAGDFLSCQ